MAESKPSAGNEQSDQLSSSARRLQDQAKWLVGIFGAVGAVIVAGSQLSSIGSLDAAEKVEVFGADLSRLHVALAGLALALTGTAVAILLAIRVQTSAHVSLMELVDYPKRRRHDKAPIWSIRRRVRDVADELGAAYLNRTWPPTTKQSLDDDTPVDSLWAGWRDAGKRAFRLQEELLQLHIEGQSALLRQQYDLVTIPEQKDWTIWKGLPPGAMLVPKHGETSPSAAVPAVDPIFQFEAKVHVAHRTVDGSVTRVAEAPSPQAGIELTAAWTDNVEASGGQVHLYAEAVDAVLEAASYSQVRLVFKRVAWQLVIVAFVVAVGLGAFVWAANPPETTASLAVEEAGTFDEVVIPVGMREPVALLVGDACDLSQPVRVRVIARSDTVALVQAQTSQDGRCIEGEVFEVPASVLP